MPDVSRQIRRNRTLVPVSLAVMVFAAVVTWCLAHRGGKQEHPVSGSAAVLPRTAPAAENRRTLPGAGSPSLREGTSSIMPAEEAPEVLPPEISPDPDPAIPGPVPVARPDPHYVEPPEIAAVLNPLREHWGAVQSMKADCTITTMDAEGNPAVTLAGNVRVDQSGPYSIDTVDSASGKRYTCLYDGTVCREQFGQEQSLSFAPTLPSLLFADVLAKSTQYATVEPTELRLPGDQKARPVLKITSRQAGYRVYVDPSDGYICRSEKFEVNTGQLYWAMDFSKYQKLTDGSIIYTEFQATAYVNDNKQVTSRQTVQLKNFDVQRTVPPAPGHSETQR